MFGGATYASLFARKRPLVWISASDIYSRVPFVFEPITFNVLCSDLSKVRLSEAVAASAAVPGVFIPMNVENFGGACGGRVPQFMQRAATLRHLARHLAGERRRPDALSRRSRSAIAM